MKSFKNWPRMTAPKFCVFILSHGRAEQVKTVRALHRAGYTGKIIFVIDDEDTQGDAYRKNFPHVEVFNKAAIASTFDLGDNFTYNKVDVYARNACFEIAKKLNYTYFIQLDDDYLNFDYRVYEEGIGPKSISNLDRVFDLLLTLYQSIPAESLAIAQGGDYIGGKENQMATKPTLSRKCMNSFICSTERRFHFFGRLNADVNTYVHGGSIGKLFFTVPFCSLTQVGTQSSAGGSSEVYLEQGTYVKSFYSVMYHPSSVTIRPMGDTHRRLHHHVKWKHTTPRILSEKVRRKSTL